MAKDVYFTGNVSLPFCVECECGQQIDDTMYFNGVPDVSIAHAMYVVCSVCERDHKVIVTLYDNDIQIKIED